MPPLLHPWFGVYLDNYRMASHTFRIRIARGLLPENQRFAAELVIGWGV